MPRPDQEANRKYQREYHSARYKTDPDYKTRHKVRTKARNAQVKERSEQLMAAFRANGCLVCCEKSSCCLVAHHLDPSLKDFNLAAGLGRYYSETRMITELAKCVCLCANCHAKFHAGEISLPIRGQAELVHSAPGS